MALLQVVSGPVSDVSQLTVPCAKPVLWTIQVTNANVAGNPNLGNTAVTVALGGDRKVTTDPNGYLTLVFGANENLSGVTVRVTHDTNLWTGNAGAPVATAADRYQSNAPLTGTYNLVVRVVENGQPIGRAPLRVAWDTTIDNAPVTGAQGGAYRKQGIQCLTDYVVSVPDTFGADAGLSTAVVKINSVQVDTTTADQRVSRDGATVLRTATNQVQVHVERHGVTVVIDFIVAFSWMLKVLVKDRGLPTATPTALNQAPITLQWGSTTQSDPRTGSDGSAYVRAAMLLGTDYTVSIPDTFGANSAASTAEVKINGTTVDVRTANTPASRDNGTASRTADNKIALRAERGVREIEVTFLLRFSWKLRVTIQDVTEKADGTPIKGAAVNLREVPVTLQWGTDTDATPRTAADGTAYKNDDLLLTTAYTISSPETYGDIATARTAEVKVNGTVVNVATADTAATRDHATVTRTSANNVTVTVASGSPEVEVNFRLQYPKVFIIGEGPLFPYAIGLAKRYAKGDAAAARTIPVRADRSADNTVLSDIRKWIVVSQFDVHDDPGGVLPQSLYVYRDAVNRDFSGRLGCFDVRKAACWTRVTNLLGRFDAMIFNNPHPGYGMHRCEVFGLRANNVGTPGKYISVHTLGYGNTLSAIQVNQFRTWGNIVQNHRHKWIEGGRPTHDMSTAQNQQYFVQTTLGYRGDGTAHVNDYDDAGGATPQGIGTAFEALNAAHIAFDRRYTHYRELIDTIGLWASILRCYRINGNAALKAGGALYLHGSDNFGNADLIGHGGHLDGFVNVGTWCDNGTAAANIYYANYATNFTSDTFHPSWFAQITFGPGEPNLANAQCFRRNKT